MLIQVQFKIRDYKFLALHRKFDSLEISCSFHRKRTWGNHIDQKEFRIWKDQKTFCDVAISSKIKRTRSYFKKTKDLKVVLDNPKLMVYIPNSGPIGQESSSESVKKAIIQTREYKTDLGQNLFFSIAFKFNKTR